jgi:hypothetical protein
MNVTASANFENSSMYMDDMQAVWFPITSSFHQETEIHKAVNYYYNVQNVFPKHYPPGGTKIIAHDVSGRSGYFPDNYDINIYVYGYYGYLKCGGIVGSTLHELGHLFHDMADPSSFWDTHILLYESFACYASWYLTDKYYQSLGFVKPHLGYDTSEQYARQQWRRTDAKGVTGGEYSPLFVDLTDDWDQSANVIASMPNDDIKDVPPSVVWDIILASKDWRQCRAELLSYAGTGSGKYYTLADFDRWIPAFDDWVTLHY